MTPRRRKPVPQTEEERQTLRELDRLKDCKEPEDELYRALLWLSLTPGVRPEQAPLLTLTSGADLALLQAFRALEMGIDVWNLLGHEMGAEDYFMDPSDQEKWAIHPTLLVRSKTPASQYEGDNLAFFRKELPKILRENPRALHSFRVRQRFLGALSADGFTREDANRLFSALWRGVAFRKTNPKAYKRAVETSETFSELRWDQKTGKEAMKEKEAVRECARRRSLTEAQVRGDVQLYRRLALGRRPRRKFSARRPRR